MTLRKTLLAATILALPLAAQAQPVNGVYIAAGAGVNWHADATATLVSSDVPVDGSSSVTIGSRVGWVGVASVGWGFGNGLRMELEGNYRSNRANSMTANGFSAPGVGGTISTYGVMVNALYDIGAVQGWPVHITLGGGVGYAWHRYSNVGMTFVVNPSFTLDQRINGTFGAFAYQGIAGVSIPIRSVPGLAITAEYRYFATVDGNLNIRSTQTGEITRVINGRINVDNVNHSVLVGVRYNFGTPAPVAAVAVQPAPARSFIVFFDFDRSDLTARAREIIAQAAGAARSQDVTRIEVAGHADRSGSDRYNLGLSQRRANTVAAELVRLGVARGAISVAAFGESRPLVPTADGVREPQNRRVEIVLR